MAPDICFGGGGLWPRPRLSTLAVCCLEDLNLWGTSICMPHAHNFDEKIWRHDVNFLMSENFRKISQECF